MSLVDYLKKALEEKWALPHFNISDLALLRGVCEAAAELRSPLLIGTSESERKFVGGGKAVALVKIFREEFGLPIFLNADHHKSVEAAQAAIDDGYDSAHIDLSKLPFNDNLDGVEKIVEYAKKISKHRSVEISVEGEVGYLVTDSSKIYQEEIQVPPESLTKVEEAERFVKETGVDRFAPAVGSIHGIAANAPKLDIARISAIRKAIGSTAMVLHGGSGVSDHEIKEAIKAGINNVHVSTELRVAYAEALRKFLLENPDESAPYKIFKPVVEAVKQKAAEKIKLFGSINKI